MGTEKPKNIKLPGKSLRQRWMKSKLRKKIRGELSPTQISFMECEFLLHPADNFSEYFLFKNGRSPEFDSTSAVAKLLAGTNPTIIDVGGNAGLVFIPILKTAGKTARAVVFEPNPVMSKRLHKNIELNGFDNVDVFNCAVGDESGQASLYFPSAANLGQGRVGVAYQGLRTKKGVTVEVRTLLECLNEAQVKKIDFLKVDVEGLEDRVIYPLLNGPTHLLPRLIYFEVEHQQHWKYPLMDTLEAKGYRLLDDFGTDHLYERTCET